MTEKQKKISENKSLRKHMQNAVMILKKHSKDFKLSRVRRQPLQHGRLFS